MFLAVQDSSIGDIVTQSVSESGSHLLIPVSSVFLTFTTVVFDSIDNRVSDC